MDHPERPVRFDEELNLENLQEFINENARVFRDEI